MNKTFKKALLIASVVVPFLLYCVYYYAGVFRRAPYKFTEFEYFTFEYGPGDSLINKYNSRTGEYQYVNSHDSLVKMNMHLPEADLLYLHHQMAEQGLWDFPEVEIGDTSRRIDGQRPLRYSIAFYYKRTSKKVLFDESFNGDPKLKAANEEVVKQIEKVLNDEQNKEEENK
ncbi:MAG TPA: hypothetical protein VHC47_09605 [Mucilaginibacter sp.]|nr:hypothetical protein [Mucilaginibacter sp.]